MSTAAPLPTYPDTPRRTTLGVPLPVVVPKWPFLICDALLIALAVWIGLQIKAPLQFWEAACILVATLCGAAFAIAPFYMEYRAEARMVEIAQLTTVAREIDQMSAVAAQITAATSHWSNAQTAAQDTATAAQSIADQIAAESKSFQEFMSAANSAKLQALALETDKLRRAEEAWVHALVSELDLVYRLRVSAVRAGKEPFLQITADFQAQCRDVARRVGLVPFEADAGEAFDAALHQLSDGPSAAATARITETQLPGVRLQGRLVRKALVAVAPSA